MHPLSMHDLAFQWLVGQNYLRGFDSAHSEKNYGVVLVEKIVVARPIGLATIGWGCPSALVCPIVGSCVHFLVVFVMCVKSSD